MGRVGSGSLVKGLDIARLTLLNYNIIVQGKGQVHGGFLEIAFELLLFFSGI